MNRVLRHPGADAQCATCEGTGFSIVRDGEYAVARPCACVRECPACKGIGFVASKTNRTAPMRRCLCQAVEARMAVFDRVGLPARHATSTRISYVPGNKAQTLLLAKVSQYVKDYDPGEDNRGLILYGDVGRGKTHLIVAMVRELVLKHGVTAKFVEFSHLLADLKSGFDRGVGAAQLLDPLVAVDVLAIDELGKGRNTEFEGTVVDELVSRRYNAMKPILATTNYAPGRATGRGTPNAAAAALGMEGGRVSLVDRIGDRVFSRLKETSDFLECRGDDYRQRPKRRR